MAEAAVAQAQAQKAFPVSWDQFHRDARALAWRLSGAGPFEAIVCVTRGGLVPAAIVSRELEIRLIETVCVASYHEYKTQGSLSVLKNVADSIVKIGGGGGQGVLIVDDLVDTGKTAKIVRDILPKAHFATVYAKPMGRPMVDTFITEVSQDTWIYFPWDLGLELPAADPEWCGVMQTKANGISINYRVDGTSGPWIVLSNSLATDLTMWDTQARELSGAFRVLRYDQRGHGKTEAPAGRYTFDTLIADALALMDALSIDKRAFLRALDGRRDRARPRAAPSRPDRARDRLRTQAAPRRRKARSSGRSASRWRSRAAWSRWSSRP